MTTFDDRERAFENLFAHDEELAFRARAKRDRDVALWAAGQLGRDGADADAYVADVMQASIERGGVEAVVSKLRDDLGRHGVAVTEHQIRHRMDQALAEAADRVKHS